MSEAESKCTRVDFSGGNAEGRSFSGHLTFEGEPPITIDVPAWKVFCLIDGHKLDMTVKIEIDHERG